MARAVSLVLFLSLLAGSAPVLGAPLLGEERMSADLRLRLRETVHTRGALPERLAVVARFDAPLTVARVRALEAAGVRFERVEGRVARVGPFVGVVLAPSALPALAAEADRILPPAPRMVLPESKPPGKVHGLTTADRVWPLRDTRGQRLTGAGMLVADIDSGVDVFHPSLFHADGGLYDWLDVDGDGVFQPDADAIDMDGDGLAGDEETARVTGGRLLDIYNGSVIDADPLFDPSRDFIYADTNGNGKRGFGKLLGFDDSTPAFGEPLFVADDVDRNGTLDPGEKVLRLGTSKVRAVWRMATGLTYERGKNLIDAPQHSETAHGTGVAGILVGGVLGGSAVQGVAPDADIVAIDRSLPKEDWGTVDPNEYDWEATIIPALDWSVAEGARVVVHEYGSQMGELADGSSDWEQVLDALSADGVLQATATHNFAGTAGHADIDVPPGGDVESVIEVEYPGGMSVSRLFVTLRWRNAPPSALAATLVAPSGQELPLTGAEPPQGWWAASESEQSPRGTSMHFAYAIKLASATKLAPLEKGKWLLRLQNKSGAPLEVRGTLADDTGYAYAVRWKSGVTDAGTMAFPSTADTALSVGASVGNEAGWGEEADGLRNYSGRGPRIDGVLGIDVIAPSDHFTAAPGDKYVGEGDYTRFDGTSGALPQVAGAAMLLLQAEPGLEPADVIARIHESAASDQGTGFVPNGSWGHGRLAAYRLLTGADPPANEPPEASVQVKGAAWAGHDTVLDASDTTDPDHGPGELTFRWDLDYDGTWDAEVTGDAFQPVPVTGLAPFRIKLEVEDPLGGISRTLLLIEPSEAPPQPEPEPDAGTAEPGAGDSATSEDTGTPATPPKAKGGDGGCRAGSQGLPPAGLLLMMMLAVAATVRRRIRVRHADVRR